jgi:hypothetical protein
MATLSPTEWKRFYEAERTRLGRTALSEMIERAPAIEIGARHAAVFPHTRLEVTGAAVAAVARTLVESRTMDVLAIGVLHGAPSRERRVHHPGEASTENEFSLDAFGALLAIAAEDAQRPAPHVHARYPLLVGDDPRSLEGMDELVSLAARMPVVATTDPVHYGIGYGDDAAHVLDPMKAIRAQLDALEAHDFAAFQAACARARSDFRDVGPVLAHVLGEHVRFEVRTLELVDYTEALGAPPPTWVAGPLMTATY